MTLMRHRARRALLVLFVATTVAATGCGGSADKSGDEASQDSREEALLALARCMRSRDIDVPDPPPGARGLGWAKPEGDGEDPTVLAVREECRKELSGTYEEFTHDDSQQEDDLVAFARCMRDQGIEMPDPELTEDFGAGAYIRKFGHTGDPSYDKADDVCREKVFGGPDQGPGGERTKGGDDPN